MDHFSQPAFTADQLADEFAYELVRGFAAVDALLREQHETGRREAPERAAERLRATIAGRLRLMIEVFGRDDIGLTLMLLAEAIDNLGNGLRLDAAGAPAFEAKAR